MIFQKNILLKKYNTFHLGGRAKYFFKAKTKNDLIRAVKLAKKINLPFFILGGGSNVLISDKGFNGLVIKTQKIKYKIQNTKIAAESGVKLAGLVSETKNAGLSGLEWAVGIPGTLGGAIRGNAGAFKSSIADNIDQVEVFDVKTEKIKILKKKDCKFSYRESIFKKNKNLIILSAILGFKKGNKKEIENVINKNLKLRAEKQPLNFPSAGSVFKNLSDVSAGELIENCNLKGKKIGDVEISTKHANFIVNLGRGKAEDVLKLIKIIKKSVKNKFGITLEEEIEILKFSTIDKIFKNEKIK